MIIVPEYPLCKGQLIRMIIYKHIIVTDGPLCNRPVHRDNSDHLSTGRPIRMIRIIYQNIIVTDHPLCTRQANPDDRDHLSTGRHIQMIQIIYQNIIVTGQPLCKSFE